MTTSPDLIIGFAFSLMSDGAPGSYNEKLAAHLSKLLEDHQSAKGELPQVALQWEIADALEALHPDLTDEITNQNKLLIVRPPAFLTNDVEEGSFDDALIDGESEHCKALQRCIDAISGGSITGRLNSLLGDAKFYEKFSGLELANLVRPSLGDLFTEDRSLPLQDNYPHGLRRYQRIRVNRLIIETVVDEPESLKRGRYLSTTGVIDSVLDHCLNHDQEINNISVVAHPLHAPRCVEQTTQALAARKLDVPVHKGMQNVDFSWDSSSAQIWCRSLSNWNQYETVVRKLLLSNS
jgi:hypothetical protein